MKHFVLLFLLMNCVLISKSLINRKIVYKIKHKLKPENWCFKEKIKVKSKQKLKLNMIPNKLLLWKAGYLYHLQNSRLNPL
jgi:hypothetical protein